MSNNMADAETSELLDDLRSFISSTSWDLSFLDDHNAAGQAFGYSMSDIQQHDNVPRAPAELLPQIPKPPNHKHKRREKKGGGKMTGIRKTSDFIPY